jgi:hypothetical protein
MKRANGENHHDTLIALNNLAWLRFLRGDLAGAEAVFRDLVPRARAAFGPQSPVTVSLLLRYGQTLSMQDRWREAEPLLADAYRGAQAINLADKQGGYAAGYGVLPGAPEQATGRSSAVDARPKSCFAALRFPMHQRQLHLAEAMVMVHEQLGDVPKAQVWRERRDALCAPAPATTQPATIPAGAPAPATIPATQP